MSSSNEESSSSSSSSSNASSDEEVDEVPPQGDEQQHDDDPQTNQQPTTTTTTEDEEDVNDITRTDVQRSPSYLETTSQESGHEDEHEEDQDQAVENERQHVDNNSGDHANAIHSNSPQPEAEAQIDSQSADDAGLAVDATALFGDEHDVSSGSGEDEGQEQEKGEEKNDQQTPTEPEPEERLAGVSSEHEQSVTLDFEAGDAKPLTNDKQEEEEETTSPLDEQDGERGPRLMLDEDDDELQRQQEQQTESVIYVDAPKVNVDFGAAGAYFVKMPNFLSVDTRPFDEEHFEDEVDFEEDQLDEEGRSRLKLKVENTIRWRTVSNKETGESKRESNAKIVRWSDGSMSLHLGCEIFDVHLQPVQDHSHLFARVAEGLQGQSIFSTKLTFRPHSTDTKTHRKMTLSMAERSSKAQKVKVLAAVGSNPEAQKAELLKREEEKLRAAAKREAQQRRVREREYGRALTSAFLEPDRGAAEEDEESEEGGESLSAIKRSYRPGGKQFERSTGRRRKRSAGSTSDEEATSDDNAADADKAADSSDGLTEQKKKKKKIVIDEEDDED